MRVSAITPRACAQDLKNAKELFDRNVTDKKEEVWTELKRMAREYVSDIRYWQSVQKLADELARRRKLNGREIAQILFNNWNTTFFPLPEKALPVKMHFEKEDESNGSKES